MTYVLLFVVLWTVAVFTEVTIAAVSLRGTIYDDRERAAAEYLLYARLGEEQYNKAGKIISSPVLLLFKYSWSTVYRLWLFHGNLVQKQASNTAWIGFGTYGIYWNPIA